MLVSHRHSKKLAKIGLRLRFKNFIWKFKSKYENNNKAFGKVSQSTTENMGLCLYICWKKDRESEQKRFRNIKMVTRAKWLTWMRLRIQSGKSFISPWTANWTHSYMLMIDLNGWKNMFGTFYVNYYSVIKADTKSTPC